MGSQERICGLCLKICNNYEAIGDMKDFLDTVLPKINLAAIQEPVICTSCRELLIKCFDFKTACFYSYNYMVSFAKAKGKVKLDLKDVHLSKNVNCASVPENQDICGFCMCPLKQCLAISLNIGEGDTLNKMIEQCLPELDLSIIDRPVICPPCHVSLDNCFRFVTNCLIVMEKIRKHGETLDLNRKDLVELSSLSQFATKDVTISEVDGNPFNIIKLENQFCDGSENTNEEIGIEDKNYIGVDDQQVSRGHFLNFIKVEQQFCESENIKEEIDYKGKSFMDINESKFNNEQQYSSKNTLICKEEEDVIKTGETFCEEDESELKGNLIEMEDQKVVVNEEIEIKTDEQDFNRVCIPWI